MKGRHKRIKPYQKQNISSTRQGRKDDATRDAFKIEVLSTQRDIGRGKRRERTTEKQAGTVFKYIVKHNNLLLMNYQKSIKLSNQHTLATFLIFNRDCFKNTKGDPCLNYQAGFLTLLARKLLCYEASAHFLLTLQLFCQPKDFNMKNNWKVHRGKCSWKSSFISYHLHYCNSFFPL